MNILDYLGTEFASFEEKPFNPVDSAALSQFCMVRAEGIVPPLRERKAFGRLGTIVKNLLSPAGRPAHFLDTLRAEHYEHMFSGLIPGRVKENMLALAASPRFRDMVIRDYLSLFDTERQTQFAAMTFVYKKEFAYVGFRGTDTSITGWRENFNMCYTAPVPAQEQAARYLEAVAPHLPRRLFVGGHSKGANLALYAALHASAAVQDRSERVYTHDGPGFKAGAFSPDDWRKLDGRIHRTVPQDSVIGMLMESHTRRSWCTAPSAAFCSTARSRGRSTATISSTSTTSPKTPGSPTRCSPNGWRATPTRKRRPSSTRCSKPSRPRAPRTPPRSSSAGRKRWPC